MATRPETTTAVATTKGGDNRMDAEVVTVIVIFGRSYGPTMSTGEAAELLSCTPEVLQRDRGKGTLPVEPLQLGRRLRWPTMKIAGLLGVETLEGAA